MLATISVQDGDGDLHDLTLSIRENTLDTSAAGCLSTSAFNP
jgi:hypothetical protein